jgi:cation diffusion facilitator CzcD-associated flavoprotein CzcO
MASSEPAAFDAVVVGAGMGGLYAVKRLRDQGLTVLGLEGAPDVGGVWWHNRYPGARVDVESIAYCYFFDPELYREWHWTERYAAQPEIHAYLSHVADRYDIRSRFRFNTWLTEAVWDPESERYDLLTDGGDHISTRFLVMATGQLSRSRPISFPGLGDFQGEWLQTSHWPENPPSLVGKRVGVIGTGASGVQVIQTIAPEVAELVVFQRTANYSIPAQNHPTDEAKHAEISSDVPGYWQKLQGLGGGAEMLGPAGKAKDLTPEQQLEALEAHWRAGGHSMNLVFSDQLTDLESNTIVGDFVRAKVREVVKDPEKARILTPHEYPIGARRIGVDIGYYEIFNRENVSIVDVKAEPIERITGSGIATAKGHYELDVIIFSLGFNAFTGAIDQSGIRNEFGESPTSRWNRGPRTYIGLMTSGFPNLFLLTAPGSPSVLANMIVGNVQHADYVGDIIQHMTDHGYSTVSVSREAEDEWREVVDAAAAPLIRRTVENYMVHVNDDGTRVFQPYPGGYHNYVEKVEEIKRDGFRGFDFGGTTGGSSEAALAAASHGGNA